MWVAMRSRNHRSWLMTTQQPPKACNPSSSARRVFTSRSLVGSSSNNRLDPSLSIRALLLLVRAAEVEAPAVGPGVPLDLAPGRRRAALRDDPPGRPGAVQGSI